MTVEVVASIFEGPGRPGDFGWMIDRPEWADALFVFNDNAEQFLAFRRDPGGARGCSPGGGNAVVRPYRCIDPPRAAGVPTGAHGQGYAALTAEARAVIDDAIGVIAELLGTGRYRRLVYSAADASGGLGTGIFRVGDEVRAYIVESLRHVAAAA
jgi:hypothetical protein